MNYTTLTTTITDICENTFTADQLAMFTKQAEQKIYETVQFPALRANASSTVATSNPYLTVPSDYLYPHSLAVVDTNEYTYLVQVDSNFIREAYPNATVEGVPKYYALFDADSLLLGPTPDDNYAVELHYGYHPESIVTATTTWLGDNFDSALLNGALVEALRFMKGEEDMIALYDKLYLQAIGLLKQLGGGKLRRDSYRSGQARDKVS